jgi:hypothetical protein
MELVAEVEQALGPGVDFERNGRLDRVGRRARTGGAWLGYDRAALVDSDDGRGRRLPILVALPASTYVGARLDVDITGGWRSAQGPILIGRMAGGPAPVPVLAQVAGLVDEGATWLDPDAAGREARLARQRFRERQSHARIVGGRAWHALGALPPEVARFSTPHTAAEYSLARLPPRFVRGLEGLLDDEERVLYWVERPLLSDVGLLRQLRGRVDRRAALLTLTDRQLLWIVDHAQPDQYLSDWGVDVQLIPVERLVDARCDERDDQVRLAIATPAGERTFGFPIELSDEVRVMRDLVARFTPAAAGSLPRRRYGLEPITFDPEPAARFGQAAEARALHEAAAWRGGLLAFLYSPRRPGQRDPAALVLRETEIALAPSELERACLTEVIAVSLTLSPLVGRLSVTPAIGLSYPAPLADRGAAFTRLIRRALANA